MAITSAGFINRPELALRISLDVHSRTSEIAKAPDGGSNQGLGAREPSIDGGYEGREIERRVVPPIVYEERRSAVDATAHAAEEVALDLGRVDVAGQRVPETLLG
jgi:hypothetical protein